MLNRIRLVLFILTIPMIAFGIAAAIQARYTSELRTILRSQYPSADPGPIERITLGEFCERPQASRSDICRTNNNLNMLRTGALTTGIAGLALLLVIRLAALVVGKRRKLLLYVFKPGLYLTTLTLLVLTVAHAVLAISMIYYGESALIGTIHIGIIAIIGLGTLAGVIVIARNVFFIVRKACTFVIGINLSHADALQLWNHVEQIADRLHTLRPEAIVVGLEPNFFVTEADVVCLSGNLSCRTLYCSLPLCRIVSNDEFSAGIGHELGHFHGLDTKLSQNFYPIYRGTASTIAELQQAGGEGWGSIPLLPAITIFSYFLECFSVVENRISRDRELAADQVGAGFTDAGTMAVGLVKIHAFSGIWEDLKLAAEGAVQEKKFFANLSKAFAEVSANRAKPELLLSLAETKLTHPTDSHPPLGVRLQSLAVAFESVADASLAIHPTDAAINLISEPEKTEEEISRLFHLYLADKLGITLGPESLSKVEFSVSPTVDVFSYMCSACHSFQDSDVNTCLKCGAENPHLRRPAQ